MMEEGRNKPPHRGLLVSCLVLILVPLLFYFIIFFSIDKFDKTMSEEMQKYSSMMFGFGTGTIFHISCILVGVLTDDFKITMKRIGNFISNLFVSPKVAFMCYKTDLKEGGVAFWPHLIIMIACFILFCIGFKECLEFYINFN